MVANNPSEYALGSSDKEHERLIRQAAILGPFTERLFCDAGIGPGQRVLELGSGAGDVAMLVARLVGPSGKVVGIERNPRSMARAQQRISEAGLTNVSFVECDISQMQSAGVFDAAVGRFILQFVPNPADVLRRLAAAVRPEGVLAFQEVTYAPLFVIGVHLPLWSKCVSIARETVQKTGANPEIGPALHENFQEARLPAPTMRLEMPLGTGPDFTLWIYDLLCSLRPQIQKYGVSLEAIGDFETLPARLQAEVAESKKPVPYIALVGAWSRKAAD